MRRIINTAITYGILALASGVVFREVTKIANYKEATSLSLIHTHLFAMGMLVFLVLISLEQMFAITTHKYYKMFYRTYNIGLAVAILGFGVRGINQVYYIEISRGLDASITGVIGVGHIVWAIGIALMLYIVKKQVLKKE